MGHKKIQTTGGYALPRWDNLEDAVERVGDRPLNTVAHAAAQGWFESLRLAWGAWLSSPGAGILAAIGALGTGWYAFRGVGKRITADRELAIEARAAEREKVREVDARERWWAAYNHLWANREALPIDALLMGVQSLEELVETQQQSAMLEVFAAYIEVAARAQGR